MYKIDKNFFKKHQKILLWIVNTKIGRFLFGVEKMGHRAKGKQIFRITPNSITTFYGYKGIEILFETQFFSRPEYAIKVGKVLFWLPVGEFYKGLVMRPAFQLAFAVLIGIIGFHFPIFFGTTDTYNSNAAGDGQVQKYVTSGGYAAAHDATTGTVYASETDSVFIQNDKVSASEFVVARYFFPFDTSSLPDVKSIIDSATFSWYWSGSASQNPNDDYICLVASSQASPTSLAAADYIAIGGATRFASDIRVSSLSGTGYKDMALNDDGLATVSKTSYTKLACRSKNDILNSAPTGRSFVNGIYYSNNASNKPKLVVVHTDTSIKTVNGLALASVKTFNGLGIESTKKVNGLQ